MPLFIWLGSGRARRRHVGPEGQWLDQAARAGLPVAPGAILLDELFHLCLEKGLAGRRDDQVIIPDPELLHNTLFYSVRLPRFERPVVVRPIIPDAAGPDAASAVQRRAINTDLTGELASGVAAAWTAISSLISVTRHDVLLMETLSGEHRGKAHMMSTGHDDRVIAPAENEAAGPVTTLRRLPGRQPADETLPPFARRLQMLLRGVRRTLGEEERMVEWVDDGRICYLTRISALIAAEHERVAAS